MECVVLGLGSNRAWNGMDCIALLRAACAELSQLFARMRVSSVYRTKPMYVVQQADFYNMAVCGTVASTLTPHRLLAEIHRIEAALGRDRSREVRNGARSIDIDIELYGNERIARVDLVIPHPRLHERAFVLVPVLEILSQTADCIESTQYAALAQALRRQNRDDVRLYMTAGDFGAVPATRGQEYGKTDRYRCDG